MRTPGGGGAGKGEQPGDAPEWDERRGRTRGRIYFLSCGNSLHGASSHFSIMMSFATCNGSGLRAEQLEFLSELPLCDGCWKVTEFRAGIMNPFVALHYHWSTFLPDRELAERKSQKYRRQPHHQVAPTVFCFMGNRLFPFSIVFPCRCCGSWNRYRPL